MKLDEFNTATTNEVYTILNYNKTTGEQRITCEKNNHLSSDTWIHNF